MKKNLFIISLLILSLGVCSCNSASSDSSKLDASCSESETSLDLTSLKDVMQKNSITGELLYEGQIANLDSCVVTGIHGNTVTVEQDVGTDPNHPEYYSIEAYCTELPPSLYLFSQVSVSGTISLVSGYRVVLTEATIKVVSTVPGDAHILTETYYLYDAPYCYYLSGQVTAFYFKLGYEVSKSDLKTLESMYLLTESVYRAFYVDVYYDNQLALNVADSFIVIYDSTEQEAKDFYDAFFDGTKENVSYYNNTISAGWGGIEVGDYFFANAKIQICGGYWFFNFDNLEARYLSPYESEMPIYYILEGYYDDRRVNFSGTLMDIHGNRISVQSEASDYPGYCIEVYLDEVPDDLVLCSQVNVTGYVKIIDNWWSSSYGYQIEYRVIENASVTTVDPSDQHLYYFTKNVFSLAWQFAFYNCSFFNVSMDILYLPESWDPYSDETFTFWATIHYSAYDSKDHTLKSPVIIYPDQDQNTKNFFHALFYGTDQDVTVSYPILSSDGSKIEPDVTIPAGYAGLNVGDSFESLFNELVPDYIASIDADGNPNTKLTGALVLTTLSGVYLQSPTF